MVVPKIHWFGDSWCSGVPNGGVPFVKLTSQQLGMVCVNHGQSNTNIDDMVAKFYSVHTKISPAADIVVFCLTSSYRSTWIDNNNKPTYFTWHKNGELSKLWNLYFANDYSTSFLTFKNINFLYYMCQSLNIKCYFVNSFSTLHNVMNEYTPDSAWLLPKSECLANKLLTIIAPEIITDDGPQVSRAQWLEHKEKLDNYFIPNDNHPNSLGNEKIAETLTNLLQLRLQ